MTERELQDAILHLASMQGWGLRFHAYDSRRSEPGVPDLLLVRSPRVIFAELKSQKGRISPSQQAWLHGLTACPGVEVYVWRPSEWPDEIAKVLAR